MSKRPITSVGVVAIAGALAFAGVAGGATSAKYKASLSAANETAKAPANAKGTFTATVSGSQLCYKLTYSGLASPVAAHIHKGAAKKDGSIVVDLKPKFAKGKAAACVPIKSAVASAIAKNPAGYYANVHTQQFPAGAMRGQLSKG